MRFFRNYANYALRAELCDFASAHNSGRSANGTNGCDFHLLREKTLQQIDLVLSKWYGLSKSISAKLLDKKTAVPLPDHWEESLNIPFPVTRKHPWTQWCQVSIWNSKSDSFEWVLVSFQGGFHSPLSKMDFRKQLVATDRENCRIFTQPIQGNIK